jgi:ABC-2 type transport system ATP-binding protein
LTKHYPGFSLAEVSFAVPAGFVMGLVGPNGAGKTTTIRAILGLVHRNAGDVRVAGVDPQEDGATARSRIGFVHDEPRFPRHLTLAATARLVGRFYADWNDATFRRLASAFGLSLGKRFSTLSRGTRMKDEVSILFSTHLTADLDRIADYVTLLQEGRVVFSSPTSEILERWGLVRGGLDLLERHGSDSFRGLHLLAHGFEAITDDAAAARRLFGDAAVVERPSLEDVVLLTSPGDRHA